MREVDETLRLAKHVHFAFCPDAYTAWREQVQMSPAKYAPGVVGFLGNPQRPCVGYQARSGRFRGQESQEDEGNWLYVGEWTDDPWKLMMQVVLRLLLHRGYDLQRAVAVYLWEDVDCVYFWEICAREHPLMTKEEKTHWMQSPLSETHPVSKYGFESIQRQIWKKLRREKDGKVE